jgi:hypothetical protein
MQELNSDAGWNSPFQLITEADESAGSDLCRLSAIQSLDENPLERFRRNRNGGSPRSDRPLVSRSLRAICQRQENSRLLKGRAGGRLE